MKASHSVGSVLLTVSALGMCACIAAVTLAIGGGGPARADSPTATPGPPLRGTPGDLWADIVVGKPDFTEISPNEVTANRVFNPGGVVVDRSVTPNRVYVYDSGNNRVLGLSHLGQCSSSGNACTNDGDCSAGTCVIDEHLGGDRVLGQAECDTGREDYPFGCGACNGDGAGQNNGMIPTPDAGTMCTLSCIPEGGPLCSGYAVSPTEGGSDASMDVDPVGNVYVPDRGNNRVLRYNNPYGSGSGDGDGVADYQWGQADFNGWRCNRGSGPTEQSLCLWYDSGVDLDSAGNLWVADSGNNRVLRFAVGPGGVPGNTANLVLGQRDFVSNTSGGGSDQMNFPTSVRVRANASGEGTVYVGDAVNRRVLEFNFSPAHELTNGQMADYQLIPGSPFTPLGLALDVDPSTGEESGLWVTDGSNKQIVLFNSQNIATKVLCNARPEYGGSITRTCGGTTGSVGVDNRGNLLVTGRRVDETEGEHQVYYFKAPIPAYNPSPTSTPYPYDFRVLASYAWAVPNKMSDKSLRSVRGVEVATGVSNGHPYKQLIASDQGRILFWNLNPNQPIDSSSNLAALKQASGFIRAPSAGQEGSGVFGRLRADGSNRLWLFSGYNDIVVYQLPLPTGTPYPTPLFTLAGPLPVAGTSSTVEWGSLATSDIEPIGNGGAIWLSDPDNSRVFRIRNADTGSPFVDVILGQGQISGTQCNRGGSLPPPYVDTSYNLATNPATRQPWTASDLDSLQVGFRVAAFGGGEPTITQVSVDVHTPGGTVTLRPNANGYLTQWETQWPDDGSPHYSLIDDVAADDDATRIKSGVWGAIDAFQFSDTGLPSGTSISSIDIKWRWRELTKGDTAGMFVFVRLGGSTYDVQPDPFTTDSSVAHLDAFMCFPGGMALDPVGNLYVADDNLEIAGNFRLLEFDADKIPTNPTQVVLDHPADRAVDECGGGVCAFFEPAFDSAGRLVASLNAYSGLRYPDVYLDPLNRQEPEDDRLRDYYSMPFAATFDEQGNLYVGDLNWGRILVYQDPFSAVPTPAPVGGIAEIPLPEPNDRSEESSFTARGRGALVEAVVTAVAMIAVGAWFARRRWRTR